MRGSNKGRRLDSRSPHPALLPEGEGTLCFGAMAGFYTCRLCTAGTAKPKRLKPCALCVLARVYKPARSACSKPAGNGYIHRLATNLVNPGHRRSFPQPLLQLFNGGRSTTDQHLDRTVGHVTGVSSDTEPLRLALCRGTEEDALYPAGDIAAYTDSHVAGFYTAGGRREMLRRPVPGATQPERRGFLRAGPRSRAGSRAGARRRDSGS